MNPIVALTVAVAVVAVSMCSAAPAASSDICSLQTTKPTMDASEITTNRDSYIERFSKMFRGYVQIEDDGKTLYMPFPVTKRESIDYIDMDMDDTKPRIFKNTLMGDCGQIQLQAIKERPSGNIIYALEQMQFQIGKDTKSCTLKLTESREVGIHTYECIDNSMAKGTEERKKIALLVIQRMALEEFLGTSLPKEYNITWKWFAKLMDIYWSAGGVESSRLMQK